MFVKCTSIFFSLQASFHETNSATLKGDEEKQNQENQGESRKNVPSLGEGYEWEQEDQYSKLSEKNGLKSKSPAIAAFSNAGSSHGSPPQRSFLDIASPKNGLHTPMAYKSPGQLEMQNDDEDDEEESESDGDNYYDEDDDYSEDDEVEKEYVNNRADGHRSLIPRSPYRMEAFSPSISGLISPERVPRFTVPRTPPPLPSASSLPTPPLPPHPKPQFSHFRKS